MRISRRSKELYNYITQLLDNNRIKYIIPKQDDKKVLELTLATGLATSIFLLTVYSRLKPMRYAASLENIILGKMPLMKYFVTSIELATDHSNHMGKKESSLGQTLDREAAKTTSRMLIQSLKGMG